jgi:peptidoglycan/xylan/chitin deacetylase (PgdA/CDA1 family)
MHARKFICFRFDVDTPLCVLRGMPLLSKLGKDAGTPFTFFVNMGRSISIRESIRALLWRVRADADAPPVRKFSAFHKLGVSWYVRILLFNPAVGSGNHAIIADAAAAGHEIGLHGGRNHSCWQRGAHRWDAGRVAREVAWGTAMLQRAGVPKVWSFASPGWNAPASLSGVLKACNLSVSADRHDNRLEAVSFDGSVRDVPTNIAGEPGGVGYIEHMRALGASDDCLLADFRGRLGTCKRFAVVYDHPCFAGVRESSLVKRMIATSRDMGFHPVTITQLADLSERDAS